MRPAMITWWEEGAVPHFIPQCGEPAANMGCFAVIDVKTRRVWSYSHLMPYPDEDGIPYGLGSGSDYAIGAVRAGKNAMEAVAIAMIDDQGTGGNVEFFDLEFPEMDVKVWDGHMPSAKFPMPLNTPLAVDDLSYIIACAKFDSGTRHDPRCDCPDASHNKTLLKPATEAPALKGPFIPRSFA